MNLNRCGLLLLLLLCNSCAHHTMRSGDLARAGELRCEHLANPLGIDEVFPRLSWKLESTQRGERQTAYRVLVASSAETLARNVGDLWDSGKVASDQSTLVAYAGRPLGSRESCVWKVRVWDKDGNGSNWSEAASWTMGLLHISDWQAKWIGLDGTTELTNADRRLPARYLRKEFSVEKPVKHAVVSVCGLGLFELQVNGRKAGDHVLEPACSEYDKRAFYETFDVAAQLAAGSNAVGVILGNGRFFGPRAPGGTTSFGYPKLLLQLDLEYADGSTGQVVTDESWKLTTNGPLGANNEYDGEEYDATREMTGWSQAGFDEGAWRPAALVAAGAPVLSAAMDEPMRVMETLRPVGMNRLTNGVYIFDMGQNMVGWCRLTATGPAGTRITLRHAETVDGEGRLHTNNLRSARVTDVYTLRGGGQEEVYEPRFTYHGFRYVEVAGFPGEPTLASIEGRVAHDALPEAGRFACSNPTLNKIAANIYWGTRGNYRSMPTDCPQRDERQGWTGDRSEESKGETYLFDVAAFYAKWLQDLRDAQRENGSVPDVAPAFWTVYNDGISWASTYIILAHALYDQYGDLRPLVANYEAMKKYIDHVSKLATNGIITRNSYGDWCVPPASPSEIHSSDPARKTDGALISTAYYYRDLGLMARAAGLLNHPADAARFLGMAAEVKAGYNQRFLDAKTGRYSNGTQTSSVLSLASGLVPEEEQAKTFGALVNHIETETDFHVGTGVIGCQWLMRTLSDHGRIDLAYRMATQWTYPSWGYMVTKGATTIWELWNGDTADPAMNSGNHVMLVGDLNIWLYEYLAGIRPDPAGPGFKKFIIKPDPCGDLTWAEGRHETPYGTITSEWNRTKLDFTLRVTVPPNTSATIYMPAKSAGAVMESDEPARRSAGVKFLRHEFGRAVFEVGAGRYEFSAVN